MENTVAAGALALPRLAWSTAEVARALGRTPDALRRSCERRAIRGENGEQVAHLELGIVAHKHGGRWHFVVPADLLGPTR